MDIEIIVVIVVIIVLFICVFVFMKDKFKGGANFEGLHEFEREDIMQMELPLINITPIKNLSDLLKANHRYLRILRITKPNFGNIVDQIMQMNNDVLAGPGVNVDEYNKLVNRYNQLVNILNRLCEIRISDEIEIDGFPATEVQDVTDSLALAQERGICTHINTVICEHVKTERRTVIENLEIIIPNIAQMNNIALINEIKNYVSHNQVDGFNIRYEKIKFI